VTDARLCRVFYQLFDVDHNDSLTRPEFEEGLKQVIDLAESGLYLDLLGVSPSLNDLIAAAKGTANPSLVGSKPSSSVCLLESTNHSTNQSTNKRMTGPHEAAPRTRC